MKCFYGHHRRDGLWQQAAVRNVHFTHAKPWDLKADGHKGYGQLNRLWWDTFLRHDPKLSSGSLQRMMLVMLIRAKKGGGGGEPSAVREQAPGRVAACDHADLECSSDDSGS